MNKTIQLLKHRVKNQVAPGSTQTHTHSLAQLFPALEEVVRGHLSGLEELVDGDGELEGDVLQSSTVSTDNIRQTEGKMSSEPVGSWRSIITTRVIQCLINRSGGEGKKPSVTTEKSTSGVCN